jgi:RNA polymerase sigma-32 factor
MLAERLDVTEQEVVDMDRRLSQDEFSLDAPVSDDSSQSHQDRLSSGAANIEDTLGEKELAERFRTELSAFGKTLTDEKERFIFEKRLTSNDPLKLQEIGDRYGVSRERARQIEAKLTQRLKEYLKARLPDFAELSFDKDD